jgi:iron complex transport system ATP-binding protein
MKAGAVVAEGAPSAVITAELVEDVYGLKCEVIPDPQTGTPLVIPAARSSRRVPARLG